MRLLRLAVAALLAATLPAGCLGDNPSSLPTAQDARPTADRQADRWAEDASLFTVSGVEVGPGVRDEIREDLVEVREALQELRNQTEAQRAAGEEADAQLLEEIEELEGTVRILRELLAVRDTPGDGRAALWAFGYLSPSEGTLWLAIGRDGVLHQEDEDDAFDFEEGFGAATLGEWSVDSDEAARIAQEANANLTRLAAHPNATAMSALLPTSGGAHWVVGVEAEGEDGDSEEAYVLLDANNGTVVVEDDLPPQLEDVPEMLFQEAGMRSDSFVGVVGSATGFGFEIQLPGHAAMATELSVTPPPVQPITVTLTSPSGAEESFGVAFAPGFTVSEHLVLDAVELGSYGVVIDAGLAVRNTWTFSWCTDGVPFDDDFTVPACERIGDADEDDDRRAATGETLSRLPSWAWPW